MRPRCDREAIEGVLIDHSVPLIRFGGVTVGDLTLNPNAQPPFCKWEALMENDQKFRGSWNKKRKDMEGKSQSEYDMSLFSLMVLAGWTDQEIVDTVITFRRKHSQDLKLRVDYYQRSLARAKETHAHETAVTELEQRLNEPPQDESTGDSRSRALTLLKEALLVEVQHVIKYTVEGGGSEYELILEGIGIRLGPVQTLLNPRGMQGKIAEASGRVIPNYKLDPWRIIAQTLLSICEEREMGRSTSDQGCFEAWLRSYLEDNKPAPRSQLAIDSRVPMLFEDGGIRIFLDNFQSWLLRARGQSLSSKDLGVLFRRGGSEPQTIAHRYQDRPTTREVWPVPDLEFLREPEKNNSMEKVRLNG